MEEENQTQRPLKPLERLLVKAGCRLADLGKYVSIIGGVVAAVDTVVNKREFNGEFYTTALGYGLLYMMSNQVSDGAKDMLKRGDSQ